MAAKKNGLSEGLADAFEADAGFGFEEVTQSDLQIPFLRIIQALSPQLKRAIRPLSRERGREISSTRLPTKSGPLTKVLWCYLSFSR